MNEVSRVACCDGWQLRLQHKSDTLNCEMHFSVYLPPQAELGPVPVLYWLSGLTCNDENFVLKAGAQRYAAEHGIALVCPDTSPRGETVADDPDGAWDFGLGAGFYVNATQAPWSAHYQMADYVSQELPALINTHFPVDPKRTGIFGHSMGGHGALTLALNNPSLYRSASAFSPIVSPIHCPWGEKALRYYLGDDQTQWQRYDSCALIAATDTWLPILVDQGEADSFLEEQLQIGRLIDVAEKAKFPMQIRLHPNYDHSYFFIASFIQDHLDFHAKHFAESP